jgi:3-oxoacyl-[acyl-carrier protein] reductase
VRNVIVTGASRGIGLAIAVKLAASGYAVIAVARKESDAVRAAAATAEQEKQGAIHFRACDLSQTAALAEFVGGVRKDFGPIYGLVNNAGLGTSGVLTLMRDEQIEALIRLNTLVPVLLSKYVVRSMMVERAGRIVNISSIVAATGYSGLSVYSATKSSLVGFTRSLAREVGQLGVTVNTVAPGFVDTEMTHELSGGQREQIMKRSALKRMAEAGDIAESVEFLLSEKARNITGVTLTVDAGNTA